MYKQPHVHEPLRAHGPEGKGGGVSISSHCLGSLQPQEVKARDLQEKMKAGVAPVGAASSPPPGAPLCCLVLPWLSQELLPYSSGDADNCIFLW